MPGKASVYIAFVLSAGLSIFAYAMFHWECNDPARFLTYFLLALVASGLKVSLPGIFGTMSVNFLFILVGVLEMSFPETLLMGCTATLVQCVYHAKFRPKFLHTSFSFSSMAVAVAASALVHAQTTILYKPETNPIAVAFVACTYFVTNTVSIATVIGLSESKPVWKVWRECYFWCFPYYLLGASIAWLLSFSDRYVGWQSSLIAIPIIYFIYRSYRSYLSRFDDQTKHVETMAALHVRTIEALALAIEAKDDTTHDHLRRVSVYAVEIGKAAGLSKVELSALHAAALLHDIGKLAVPENIISKPGKLKPEEFEKMKIHPVVGAEILDRVQFPYPVVPIVRSHHEKWDGSGYPTGLKGEEIPLGARILSAVDCLDALTSDRQYRRALPLDEAMAKVASESGKSFDPRIVELLQARYIELERMAKAQPDEPSKLSRNLKIRNSAAPAAGFERHHIILDEGNQATNFLASIVTARREAQVMFEFTESLGKSLSLAETLPVVARTVRRMIAYDSFAVYLLRDQTLRPAFVDGPSSQIFSSLEIPLGAGLSGWVARNNEPIINGNPAVEPGYAEPPAGIVLRSALATPLIGSSGVIGVIALYDAEKDVFSKDDLRILCEISSKAASSLENALKYQEVESSATTDYVTGLPNARSLFLHLEEELVRCRRFNSHLAVLVCDLDGFKQVNDRLGHLEGNELLFTVGNGLRDCCRESDYVARLGGDEFVVILPDTQPEAIAAKVRLFNQMSKEASRLHCGEDILSISVGEAFYPGGGITPDQLLNEADRQMFNAKRRNKRLRLKGGLDQPPVRPDVIMLPGPPSSLTH